MAEDAESYFQTVLPASHPICLTLTQSKESRKGLALGQSLEKVTGEFGKVL